MIRVDIKPRQDDRYDILDISDYERMCVSCHRRYDADRRERTGARTTAAIKAHNTSQWGKYSVAIRRWEQLTRSAPSPTEPNRNGNPRLNPAFSEWMMGWPAGWATAVPGISRNDQLRIIGNGVVPQCASVALRWLLSVDCVVAS